MKKIPLFFIAFLLSGFVSSAQVPAPTPTVAAVAITGRAYDKDNRSLPLTKLMIINKRSGNGIFADAEGKFALSILPTDTLIFSAIGFKVKKVSLKDSLATSKTYFEIGLQKLQYDLAEVSVFPQKSLNDIQKDIDKLGVKNTHTVEGIEAVESPITYLYERFSKFGKQKQKVAEWENADLKRDVLKDLFRLYVKYDIIDLNDDEFDAFVKYLNLSDEFIQNATQFELVMAIKGRYESFKYRWK